MMRKVVVLSCCLLLLVGCSRKAPPVKMSAVAKALPRTSGPADSDGYSPWDSNFRGNAGSPAAQAQSAERFSEKLQSANATTASEAAVALGAMGEQGYPHLVKGMQSPSDNVRLTAMKSMHIKELVKHEAETLPILVAMLGDPNPALRCSAVGRLPWYGKPAGKYLQIVQAMANADPDGNVRAAAAVAVNGLYEAMSGKKITGAPEDPTVP